VFSYFKGIYYVHMNSNWIRFDWYNSKFHAATMSVIVENNISYICHRNIYNLQYTIFYISMLTTRNWMTVLHGHMLFSTLKKNYINKTNIFLKIYNHLTYTITPWLYSPLKALAFLVTGQFFSVHRLLSPPLTFISQRSFSTSTNHLNLGLPILLLLPFGLL